MSNERLLLIGEVARALSVFATLWLALNASETVPFIIKFIKAIREGIRDAQREHTRNVARR